ncbi:MAG: CdaR family protein [Pyrinomonadaceae bacterium]|nr:CdaR family protein [Pyrinomonadaceae bacterium]MCX7639518.1 CdaR family protein [Pyrinomonadaceae bacterium]MDW8304431.1 CdaR family protein [Acidobacteriota bacterium]
MTSRRNLQSIIEKLFLRDWALKFVALTITLILWFSLGGLRPPSSKRISNVQLSFSYSSEMELVNTSAKEVDIIITGDKTKIDKLRREDLIVSVDLSNLKPGEKTVRLLPETIGIELPSGVKIEEIQPSKISVRLERLLEREVPVKPELEGSPAKGFEIYSYTVSPPRISVRGPESYVKALDSVSTEKIDIENLSESTTFKGIEINIINPKIRPSETSADVTLQVGEKRLEQTFLIPYEVQNKRKLAAVTIFAPRSVLEKLDPKDIKITITENTPHVELPETLRNRVEIKNVRLK